MQKCSPLAWIPAAFVAFAALASRAHAQCLEWNNAFAPNGINDDVAALAMFDDGSGPALYIGGHFTSAGGLPIQSIARWTGSSWAPLGTGIPSATVTTMVVFDDGSGPALYVGGNFTTAGGVPANRVARWNGTTWSAVGLGMSSGVNALCVYDDGNGPALYAGGVFATAEGNLVGNIAKWDGVHWSALAGGVGGEVYSLTTFDFGSGPELVVGGDFSQAGGLPASNIARWNGSTWSALAGGTDGSVNAFAVFDDGGGSALYAGGMFTHAGGNAANRVAKWNGSSWSAVGGGMDNGVLALSVFDDGSGAALYAGGSFTAVNGAFTWHVARWNGTQWSGLGIGVNVAQPGFVAAFLPFTHDGATSLCIGGLFTSAGNFTAGGIAGWTGTSWFPLGPSVDGTIDSLVYALAEFDDGTGSALYAGGTFLYAGGQVVRHIARWDGHHWSPLGSGTDGNVWALAVFDDGNGPALYVAGAFTTVDGAPIQYFAKWDGTQWSAISGSQSADGIVYALCVFDDGGGPALYLGGVFTTIGGVSTRGIAKWDGVSFHSLGNGVSGGNPITFADVLQVHDGGNGPELFVGGQFASASGLPAAHIARWNGTSWSSLSTGLDMRPYGMASFDDGNGPALYVVGPFTTAGGVAVNHVAKWDGASWSALGAATNGTADCACVFDDGSGPALYIGGAFTTAGGVAASSLAKWNGSTWSAVGGGLGATPSGSVVTVMTTVDDGNGTDLFAAGGFDYAGSIGSRNIAQWRGCGTAIAKFCAGDGSALECPCNNNGLAGHGCQNSATTGGATLFASGTTQPDTIVLHAAGELPSVLSIFLQGNAPIIAVAFGDGLRCTGGSLKRLYVKHASGGAVDAPTGGDLSITARSAALGDVIVAGATRYYQTYYRDSNLAFCSAPAGNSWNVTNGVKITW